MGISIGFAFTQLSIGLNLAKMKNRIEAGLHFIGGALFGICISWVENCTLAEISVNKFFSLYFGILFIVVGLLLSARVLNAEYPVPKEKRFMFKVSAVIVSISGILCIVLETGWFHFSAIYKVPLYTILGISIGFAFTFSLLDSLNSVIVFFRGENAQRVVETIPQIRVVVISCVTLGATFGTIFGMMDIEDNRGLELRDAILREEQYCKPIGVVIGGTTALLNYYLRDDKVTIQKYEYDSEPIYDI